MVVPRYLIQLSGRFRQIFINKVSCSYTVVIYRSVMTFRWDIPVALYRIIKYKQNIVKHNSINDFNKMYSYIVSFNNMFRL